MNLTPIAGTDLLRSTEELVEPALKSWTQMLQGDVWSWAGYHLGWLDADGLPVRRNRGKGVRPALVLAACRARGQEPSIGVSAAVAVELVHNFSLLHDDIIDGDELRRHFPTVWKAFGVHAGVLAGDALLAQAFRVVADSPNHQDGLEATILAKAVQDLIEGQALDVSFEARSRVSVAEYEAMAAGKTGSLMGAACALGALAGGADPGTAEHMAAFGRHLGIAFQIIDDILGITGNTEITGKPVGADITARKKSLPLLAALNADDPAATELASLWNGPKNLSAGDIGRAIRLVKEAGGIAVARALADEHLQQAHSALDAAEITPPARTELDLLTRLLVDRDH
ncbi:polyprenyl synthetase family protein [Streptomyces cellulosae]